MALLFAGLSQGFADASTNTVSTLILSKPYAELGISSSQAPAGHFSLRLFGDTNYNWSAESSTDLVNWTSFASNLTTSTSAYDAPDSNCFYRARLDIAPLFTFAIGAQSFINVIGIGTIANSFNSYDTNQSVDGRYSGFSGTNGNLACMAGFVSLGNATLNGSLFLGTNASYDNSGTIIGTVYTNSSFQFPAAALPTTDVNGGPIVWEPAPTTFGLIGGKYQAFHNFTNDGYYAVLDSVSIVVESNITVCLDVKTNTFAPSSIDINGGTTNSGTLVIYQESGITTFTGNSSGGPIGNRPHNLVYIGLPAVTSVAFSGISDFTGAIYAPNSLISLNGGTVRVINLCGSFIADSITINGHYIIHFDEALLTLGPFH